MNRSCRLSQLTAMGPPAVKASYSYLKPSRNRSLYEAQTRMNYGSGSHQTPNPESWAQSLKPQTMTAGDSILTRTQSIAIDEPSGHSAETSSREMMILNLLNPEP